MLNRRPAHASLRTGDPFSAPPAWRRLGLVVDPGGQQDLAAQFLLGYGSTESADVLVADDSARARVVLGEALLDPMQDYIAVEVIDARGAYLTAVPAATSLLETADRLARDHDRDPADVRRLVALYNVARTSRWIDAFVSDDPLTLAAIRDFVGTLTSSEGAALLGLALRAKGDFTVERDGNHSTYIPDEAFYRAAALELVGGTEAWYRTTSGAWRAGRARPYELLQGTIVRIARALRARDYLQIRMRSVDFETAWSEVLFFFDALLVALSGALDTAARLVHEVYGLPASMFKHAGWSRTQWLTALAIEDGRLAAEATEGELGRVSQLISRLRNRVHEAPFSEELYLARDRPGWLSMGRGVIALPRESDSIEIVSTADETAGADGWGLRDRADLDVVLVDPGVYTERAVRMAASAIASVLREADRDRLGPEDDVQIERLQTGNPAAQYQAPAFMLAGLGSPGLWIDRVTY